MQVLFGNHRCAVAHDGVPWHDAAETDGNAAIEQRAGNKRCKNAEGQIALMTGQTVTTDVLRTALDMSGGSRKANDPPMG